MGHIEGIRVLDISKYGPTRCTSMIPGDLGAEVIAVDIPATQVKRSTWSLARESCAL